MTTTQPAYVIPLLVEQPTWGGSYIATSKELAHPLVQGKRVGQSFELFSGSWLTTASPVSFAYATATEVSSPQFADPQQEKLSLQELIDQDALAVLGQKGVERGWKTMQVLIKFTQAQNNSYQVHVKPGQEFGKWLPKPESWYFLEKGKATLGLSDVTAVSEYKARCLAIDQKAHELSEQVQSGSLSVDAARLELRTFIDEDHPRRFVNTVSIEKGAVIDLSQGGTHHSWEVDPELPEGNIVYEVQVDVMDDQCTIRSFDQGNIKNDGSVRPLAIEDYFKALDTDPQFNAPNHYLQQPAVTQDSGATVTTLFSNQFYVTERIEFSQGYQGHYTRTNGSFHHLYPLEESIQVVIGEQTWFVPAGWSLFIPAAVAEYQLQPTAQKGNVLITHL